VFHPFEKHRSFLITINAVFPEIFVCAVLGVVTMPNS